MKQPFEYTEINNGQGLQPGWLSYRMMGPPLGLRGLIIISFFWIMQAWPIYWPDLEE